jgi:hypothetical protein
MGYYIRFRQKKTKGVETLPISEQAYSLLGEQGENPNKIFEGLNYSTWSNLKLQQWVMKAGISKTYYFSLRTPYLCNITINNGNRYLHCFKIIRA